MILNCGFKSSILLKMVDSGESDSICTKCVSEIVGDDGVECDNCDGVFHLTCIKVTKTEKKARKNSKCLRMYCPDCVDNRTADKLKAMMSLMLKMDLLLQEKKLSDNNLLTQMNGQLKKIDENIKNSNNINVSSGLGNNASKRSFTNAVKRSTVNPAVVIKPKQQQSCAKTLDELKSNLNNDEIKVCGTRNARNGGVVIRCDNANETVKVQQMIGAKLGNDYEIVMPKVKMPRIRITNINEDIRKEDILAQLKQHNAVLKDVELKLITLIARRGHNHYAYNDAVVELNSNDCQKLLGIGKLSLPWCECLVLEHVHVSRCYKCCGFFHKSTECKQSQKCSRCAGDHKYSECKNTKKMCCVNCKYANTKYNTNNNINHNAMSKMCPIYKRRMVSLVNNIEFCENK